MIKKFNEYFDNKNSKHKYLFLDVDGVLIPFEGKTDHRYFNEPAKWSKAAMNNLNKIIEETGAKVIISSTYRKTKTKEEIQEAFEKVGFKYKIEGLLPYHDLDRASSMNRFLKDKNNIDFAILDDHKHQILRFFPPNNFVKVKTNIGISSEDAKKAINTLNK